MMSNTKGVRRLPRATLSPGLATSRRESAEEQGLRRRILDPGKVMRVYIQTEKWLKDSCRYFISLAMAYKFDSSLQHVSVNAYSNRARLAFNRQLPNPKNTRMWRVEDDIVVSPPFLQQ